MVPAKIGQDTLVPIKLSRHPPSDAVLVVTWEREGGRERRGRKERGRERRGKGGRERKKRGRERERDYTDTLR